MVKRLDNKKLEESVRKGDDVKVDAPSSNKMRFRVPPNGPGRQVRVNPPNGGPAFMVQVPATARVGDLMQVEIPNRNRPASPRSPPSGGVPGTQLMKVVCPANKRPGDYIQMNVPGKGLMRVQVPATGVPGQPFYFRISN